ncbi:MAG: S8 family serine peptidase, partial [Candidatus Thorarchaeota archaeon]
MADDGSEPRRRRGTVLLLTTIIIIGSIAGLYAVPPSYSTPELTVRVAIIDSGITINQELEPRVIAERSFVNSTYGYSEDDNSTMDSNPEGIPHGTYIAAIIASEAPDAALVNAKVVSSDDIATPAAIVEAIRWVVLEENCSVINLSLGFSPIDNDLVGEAVQWAFSQGVSIVAAAGNNGQNGISGSSVESPAMYPEVIAVAAVDESNELYSFSARGPLRDRVMKPDISALGIYNENGRTVLGTSFAAPIVTAGVSMIISHCITNGWSWTPGMIKAAVMIGASNLPYEEWQVGAGLFDLDTTLLYIDFAQKRSSLPLVAVVTPTVTPFSFERYFINHTSRLHISIFASGNDTFTFSYGGVGSKWLEGPTSLYVNQSGSFDVSLRVESSEATENEDASISIRSSGYMRLGIEMEVSAITALNEVAFDISHTSWSVDSTYGQFRELYRTLINAGIAVDELRDADNLTSVVLSSYDAVFVLDPCAWGTVVDEFSYRRVSIYTYTPDELAAYAEYYENGGNLFLVGLSNSSIDHAHANDLYSLFNITLVDDHIPGITITINGVSSTKLITDMIPHNITNLVDSFDYNGCSLNFTGDGYEIAWTEYRWADTNGTIHKENR